ncbi:MAG: bifunctional DNA-formamidopyrimidine glycosylase/DNA-(apurinic or apyrimidinic site) lyase [Patescibacteria group bacterium]
MPELPEVHTTATILDKIVKGFTITDLWTNYNSPFYAGKDNIKNAQFFKKFKKILIGVKIKKVHRRGKNVLIDTDNGHTIIIHMKMTGHILVGNYKYIKKENVWEAISPESLKDPFNQWVRFLVSFSNGKHMALSDLRKFAKVTVVPSATAENSAHLKGIGPEPLEKNFGYGDFTARLALKPRGKIKQVLMDPAVIAGIGNIYSDEILWASGVHPKSITGEIPAGKLSAIFRLTKEILEKGIDFGGDSMSDYRNPNGEKGAFQYHHKAYRNTGKACQKPSCKGKISKIKMGGRHAHFCDKHQKEYS